MPNLNEEIAAMAFSSTSAQPGDSSRTDDIYKYPHNMSSVEKPQKTRRSRSRLVQEIRISVSITASTPVNGVRFVNANEHFVRCHLRPM